MRLVKAKLYICLTFFVVFPTCTDHEKIIAESATIAEDITGLIIACKKTKDAKLITEIVKKLLCDTAQLTQSIIENRKEKKAKRSLPLNTFASQDTASNSFNDVVNTILVNVYPIIEEVSLSEDMEAL